MTWRVTSMTPRARRRRRSQSGAALPGDACPPASPGAVPLRSRRDETLPTVWHLCGLVSCYFRFVATALLLCLDTFLHHLVVVPLRAPAALLKLASGRGDAAARRAAAVEALLAAYLAATCAFLFALVDQDWVRHEILQQRIVKLYWGAQALQSFDRVYSGWFGTLLRYHARASSAVGLALTAAATQAYLFVQAAVLHALVLVLVVSASGGGEGIGRGVDGGAAIVAVLVPVQLLSELKGSFTGFTRERLTVSALTDVAHLSLYLVVFALVSVVPGVPSLKGGAAFFVAADLVLHLVKQATIVRDSGLPANVHRLMLRQLANAWVSGRRGVLFDTLGSVSLALAAVAVRVALDGRVTVAAAAKAGAVLLAAKAGTGAAMEYLFAREAARRGRALGGSGSEK